MNYFLDYTAILSVSLYIFRGLSDIELVTIWSMISCTLSIPFLIYLGLLVRRHTQFQIPYMAISKYLLGGMGLIITFVFTNEHIVTFETSIFHYLPNLILELMLCCAVYLGITYAIDYKTRELSKLIILEIQSMWHRP